MEVFGLKTVSKRLYEAMFLVDSGKAASDWNGIQKVITNILERADGEVVSIKRWDERKLAYEIGGHSRGTYVLCYFRGNGRRNADIERSFQLSEQIIRVLILCADHVKPEDIEKDAPATLGEADRPKLETDEAMEKPADQEQPIPKVLAETEVSEHSETEQDSAEAPEKEEDAVAEQTEAGGSEQEGESGPRADEAEQETKGES
jgi:small subunit ribosomal protein S6